MALIRHIGHSNQNSGANGWGWDGRGDLSLHYNIGPYGGSDCRKVGINGWFEDGETGYRTLELDLLTEIAVGFWFNPRTISFDSVAMDWNAVLEGRSSFPAGGITGRLFGVRVLASADVNEELTLSLDMGNGDEALWTPNAASVVYDDFDAWRWRWFYIAVKGHWTADECYGEFWIDGVKIGDHTMAGVTNGYTLDELRASVPYSSGVASIQGFFKMDEFSVHDAEDAHIPVERVSRGRIRLPGEGRSRTRRIQEVII